MAQALWRMGVICDNEDWKRMSSNMTLSLSHLIVNEPNYMSNWGIVYSEIRKGLVEVVFAGGETGSLLEMHKHFNPYALAMSSNENEVIPLTAGKQMINGKPTIYVCFDKTCQKPVNTVEEANEQIHSFV